MVFGLNEDTYRGSRIIEDCEERIIAELYAMKGVPVDQFNLHTPFYHNQYLILRNGSASVLAVYQGDTIWKVDTQDAAGISPRNAEQIFSIHALLNMEIPLVTLAGKAGTGKTLLALSAAIECRKWYRQILLARPIVPLSNKDLGYLPGDVKEKINPYMIPLYDNLGVIKDGLTKEKAETINKMVEEEKLVIEPLAYIRGRTLVKKFMIVDEAQNLTPIEVKTIVTRAGKDTKIVFTGDVDQIDHPRLDKDNNGFTYLQERLEGQPLYSNVTLVKGERSPLADMAAELL